MSHRLERNFTGAMGEHFAREIFKEQGLRSYGLLILVNPTRKDLVELVEERPDLVEARRIKPLAGQSPGEFAARIRSIPEHLVVRGSGEHDLYYEYDLIEAFRKLEIERVYGTQVWPDFIVKDRHALVEVKTGRYPRLRENQKAEFPKLIAKGFRLFEVNLTLQSNPWKIEVIPPIACKEMTTSGMLSIGFEEMIEQIKAMPVVKMNEPEREQDTFIFDYSISNEG